MFLHTLSRECTYYITCAAMLEEELEPQPQSLGCPRIHTSDRAVHYVICTGEIGIWDVENIRILIIPLTLKG